RAGDGPGCADVASTAAPAPAASTAAAMNPPRRLLRVAMGPPWPWWRLSWSTAPAVPGSVDQPGPGVSPAGPSRVFARGYRFPSPSLGPPLLSASWSPPLPCGTGLAVWAGAVAGGAGGVVAAACTGREWW